MENNTRKIKNAVLPKPGLYKHYKGNIYKVIAVARSSENKETQVVYQAIYGNNEIWTRSLSEWNQTVEVDGEKVKRFRPFDISELDFYFDKVGLLCIKNGKMLSARSRGKEHFYVPGGKRELLGATAETDIECLVREAKEELGIDIDPSTASYYGTYLGKAYDDKPPANIIFYQAKFRGTPKPNQEIEEVAWLGYKDRNKTIGSGRIIMDELYWKGLIK